MSTRHSLDGEPGVSRRASIICAAPTPCQGRDGRDGLAAQSNSRRRPRPARRSAKRARPISAPGASDGEEEVLGGDRDQERRHPVGHDGQLLQVAETRVRRRGQAVARSSVVCSAATASMFGSGRSISLSIGIPSVPMIISACVSGTRGRPSAARRKRAQGHLLRTEASSASRPAICRSSSARRRRPGAERRRPRRAPWLLERASPVRARSLPGSSSSCRYTSAARPAAPGAGTAPPAWRTRTERRPAPTSAASVAAGPRGGPRSPGSRRTAGRGQRRARDRLRRRRGGGVAAGRCVAGAAGISASGGGRTAARRTRRCRGAAGGGRAARAASPAPAAAAALGAGRTRGPAGSAGQWIRIVGGTVRAPASPGRPPTAVSRRAEPLLDRADAALELRSPGRHLQRRRYCRSADPRRPRAASSASAEEPAREDVVGRVPQRRLQLHPRARRRRPTRAAPARASAGPTGRPGAGREARPRDADGLGEVAGLAVLLRQLREQARPGVALDPPAEFVDPRVGHGVSKRAGAGPPPAGPVRPATAASRGITLDDLDGRGRTSVSSRSRRAARRS